MERTISEYPFELSDTSNATATGLRFTGNWRNAHAIASTEWPVAVGRCSQQCALMFGFLMSEWINMRIVGMEFCRDGN